MRVASAAALLAALYFLFLDTNIVAFTLSVLMFTFLYHPIKSPGPAARYAVRREESII